MKADHHHPDYQRGRAAAEASVRAIAAVAGDAVATRRELERHDQAGRVATGGQFALGWLSVNVENYNELLRLRARISSERGGCHEDGGR